MLSLVQYSSVNWAIYGIKTWTIQQRTLAPGISHKGQTLNISTKNSTRKRQIHNLNIGDGTLDPGVPRHCCFWHAHRGAEIRLNVELCKGSKQMIHSIAKIIQPTFLAKCSRVIQDNFGPVKLRETEKQNHILFETLPLFDLFPKQQ